MESTFFRSFLKSLSLFHCVPLYVIGSAKSQKFDFCFFLVLKVNLT